MAGLPQHSLWWAGIWARHSSPATHTHPTTCERVGYGCVRVCWTQKHLLHFLCASFFLYLLLILRCTCFAIFRAHNWRRNHGQPLPSSEVNTAAAASSEHLSQFTRWFSIEFSVCCVFPSFTFCQSRYLFASSLRYSSSSSTERAVPIAASLLLLYFNYYYLYLDIIERCTFLNVYIYICAYFSTDKYNTEYDTYLSHRTATTTQSSWYKYVHTCIHTYTYTYIMCCRLMHTLIFIDVVVAASLRKSGARWLLGALNGPINGDVMRNKRSYKNWEKRLVFV